MSWLSGLVARSSPENPAVPLTDVTLAQLFGPGPTASGVTVTETSALGFGPVYRATAVIAGLGGALPIHVRARGSYAPVTGTILDDPHPDLTPLEFWQLTYVRRALWGNFYAQKVRNNAGALAWLYPIDPARVRVGKAKPTEANPSGKVFQVTLDDGTREEWTSREVFHLPGLGYDGICGVSPVRVAREAIGLGLAAQSYGARLFGSGSLLSGVLQTEQRLNQTQAEALQARWAQRTAGIDNSHRTVVLDAGASFQSVTMPNDDAQFLESRSFQAVDVARWFGIPPSLLFETDKATSWGTGLEQQARAFVTIDLHPLWLAPTEQRITKELLRPIGGTSMRDGHLYAKYQLNGLLRGDSAARAAFYTAMRNLGAMSANEIRELEDMAPIADGDGYLQPLNMAPLGSDQTASDPAATAIDQGGASGDPAAN